MNSNANGTSSPVTEDYLAIAAMQAQTQRALAVDYCTRGLHRQAAAAFRIAAVLYGQVGDWPAAARCEGQQAAELRQCRPSPPVNISALVD